jgi:hypothetical protein
MEVHVGVLVDRDAAVAKASLMHPGSPYAVPLAVTTGSCKRHTDDEPDDETATLYATARALRKMANKLEKQASARVRHADANRRHRGQRLHEHRLAMTQRPYEEDAEKFRAEAEEAFAGPLSESPGRHRRDLPFFPGANRD